MLEQDERHVALAGVAVGVVGFEAEAPGPLLASSEEVLVAARDTGAAAAGYEAAYQAFAAKYCPLDDGKAVARVCDRLFGG